MRKIKKNVFRFVCDLLHLDIKKSMFNLALTYCLDDICTFLLFTKRSQVLLLHSRVVRLPVSVMQSW